MKIITKITLAATAAASISAGTVLGDTELVRIDHPRSQPTFVYRPSDRATTIAVYAGGRTFISNAEPVVVPARVSEGYGKVQLGRGQVLTLATASE